tara:strand:+ start:1879 stop:2904 length:1026 start_codon:yes stop_codon:yes gene_type:complete
MQKILAIIDFKSLSINIKEGDKFIFNSKSLIQYFYDVVHKTKYINNTIFLNNQFEICKNNFEIKSDLDKTIPIKLIDQEFSYSQNGILKVIKELEERGYFFDFIVYLSSNYPAINSFILDDAISYFNNVKNGTSLISVEKVYVEEEELFVDSLDEINIVKKLSQFINDEKILLKRKIYLKNEALSIFSVESIKNGSFWGQKCLKYDLGSKNANLNNYSNLPKTYGALDQLDTLEKIKKKLPLEVCFDIDGVLFSRNRNYSEAIPNFETITFLKKIYSLGHKIVLHTARGSKTGIDWQEITKEQLRKYSVPYHEIIFGKPGSDFYVDDRSISLSNLIKIFNN